MCCFFPNKVDLGFKVCFLLPKKDGLIVINHVPLKSLDICISLKDHL